MDKEEPPLTRDDFADQEGWLRHCHEGGIDLARDNEHFEGVTGSGPYARLQGAIYGTSKLDFLRTWAKWGVSWSLRWRQFVKGYEAIAFANCLGLVLDSAIHITWSLQGIHSDLAVADRQKAFLDAIRRWFERHDEPAAFYWVLERGSRRGLHSHIALRIPPHLTAEFHTYANATLARIVKGPLVHRQGERTMLIQPRRGRDIVAQWKLFAYLMKGLDSSLIFLNRANPAASPRVSNWTFINFKPQGEISVKRMGVSRILDDATRRRWRAVNNFPSVLISVNGPPFDDRYLQWFYANRDDIVMPTI
ncbi:hypothetical protein [Sphingobium xenophagum]|uniref:rolling circle replication-associated protein n=1 Tax=Sphingobium xenophagum TaxID=121428 RepID=UPI0036D21048|tara:strand:- start:1792 stop:2709 length:918 start_codon:yes stop_codon:yes gene_type:complete